MPGPSSGVSGREQAGAYPGDRNLLPVPISPDEPRNSVKRPEAVEQREFSKTFQEPAGNYDEEGFGRFRQIIARLQITAGDFTGYT